jgi:hypothetical protein
MPAKAASARVPAKVAAKSVRVTGGKPRAKKAQMSKLEAKRLESFKALVMKYGGKLQFAGYDR